MDEPEGSAAELDAADMHFGVARMFAKLAVQLVRNGALTEANVAEILVGEERVIAAHHHQGDLRAALALSALQDAVSTELEKEIELRPHVEQLHRRLGRPPGQKSPRQLLDMTADEMRQEIQKYRPR